MADIPKYNGTVHPEEWVKNVQAKCLLNNLRQEKDVLKMCKLNIALSISFPNEVNTLNELVKALKEHSTYDIYKNGCKEKLDQMTFEGGEGGDTTQFLADFRSLCDFAEINNPQEIKNRLLRTYSSNEFFKNEFSRRITGVTNIDEIFKLYSDVVSDSSRVIKYGPEYLIAIKHRETGKYLSSRELNYATGSKRQVVYAGEKILNENAWWYATCENPIPQKKPFQENKVLYDDVVYLTHNKTKATISFSDFYRSPKTSYAEVHCFAYAFANLRFVKTDYTNENNKTPYLKARDRVYIKTENEYILRSQDVTFDVEENPDTDKPDNKNNNSRTHTLQEVVGHKERVGKDDEWFIEKK
uniref:Stromal cell-derived factor 2-like protein n=1 Tax=Anthurium amnicola TaxID=1678845 RepID=A0A1D1Z045_9ARAE